MLLRELEIENLRSIRSARVELGPTTTLIGENDAGLRTVLAALELVLGGSVPPSGVRASELLRPAGSSTPAGPLRIALTFEEREPGEWERGELAELARALPRAGGRRRAVLEARTADGRADAETLPLELAVREVRPAGRARELALLVRRASPLIRIAGSELGSRGPTSSGARGAKAVPRDVAPFVARLLEAADELLDDRSAAPEQLLERGFEAANALFERRPEHIGPDGGGLTRSVLEILGREEAPCEVAERSTDGVARRLGVLLLIAALLRRVPAGLAPGSEPIWAIESPEALLHPMTLAAVAELLERVRWQKLVATNSPELLARSALAQVRRLVQHEGVVVARGVRPKALSAADLRRVGHHLRARRGVAMFARVWLLVEGESEFWVLPQLAAVLGHALDVEGVACVEFAQAGLEPLVRTAEELGIEWHVLADGDEAGRHYAETAERLRGRRPVEERVTRLRERDLEHCLFAHGLADAMRRAAGLERGSRAPARRVIERAVQRQSKPGLALLVVDAVARAGPEGVPAPLARLIERCVELARRAPARQVIRRPGRR